MGSIVPSYDAVPYQPAGASGGLITSQALAKGAVVSATLDLTATGGGAGTGAFGAWLRIRIGRLGATPPSSAPLVGWSEYDAYDRHPVVPQLSGNTATPNVTSVSTTATAGATTLVVASATGLAAGQQICIGAGTAREEYNYISAISGTTLTLQQPLVYGHTSVQADAISNNPDVFVPMFLQGGKKYLVFVDYGAAATGSNIQPVIDYTTWDSASD